jgi:hypothetical protein
MMLISNGFQSITGGHLKHVPITGAQPQKLKEKPFIFIGS